MPALVAIFCFVVGLVTALWQSPYNVAPRSTLYYDSGHYLESCRCLTATIGQYYAGTTTENTAAVLANALLLDGPILPSAGSVAFALAGQTPESAAAFTLVIMQCLFHGLAAALTCLITIGLSKNKYAGITAGLLWALYPSAIVATNSFLTEPLAVTLFLALIYLLYQFFSAQKIGWRTFLAVSTGSISGLLLLLKPALLPAIVLLNLSAQIMQRKNKQRLAMIFPLCFGLFLTLAPWLLFTKYATGTIHLLPSRRPVYNIVSGCNLETDGWGTYPDHPLISLYTDDSSAVQVASSLLGKNPPDAVNLLLRKSARFWAAPWNDYRYKIFGLNYKIQSFIHCLLLLIGFYGLLYFTSKLFSGTLEDKQKFVVTACLFGIFCHGTYILFEGIPRYFFTAMPLFIILALSLISSLRQTAVSWAKLIAATAYNLLFVFILQIDPLPFLPWLNCLLKVLLGLAALISTWLLLKPNTNKKVFSGIIILAGIYLAALLTAHSSSSFESHEWVCDLSAKQKASRDVFIEGDQTKPDWVLLFVDGDSTLANAEIRINGHRLTDKLLSVYQYYGERYELQDFLNTLGLLLRKNPEDLPKWRAVKVPLNLVKIGSWNNISLTSADGSKVTIYGDYPNGTAQERSLQAFNELSPGKLLSSGNEQFESRIYRPVGSPLGQSKSYLDGKPGDLSDSFGKQTGDYRMFLVFGYKQAENPLSTENTKNDGQIQSTWNPATNPVKFDIALPDAYLNKPLLNIGIKLMVRSPQGKGQLVISGLINKQEHIGPGSILPGSPKLYSIGSDWQNVEFSAVLPSSFLRQTKARLLGEISSLGTPLQCQDLKIILSPEPGPELEKHTLKFF
ncbi:MAG: hypothetical protein K2W82_12485 [Candidatus Obscuribacterales bacterium]|nr:hypothetical protein [Candidatus Obscuribacterales bacterium]